MILVRMYGAEPLNGTTHGVHVGSNMEFYGLIACPSTALTQGSLFQKVDKMADPVTRRKLQVGGGAGFAGNTRARAVVGAVLQAALPGQNSDGSWNHCLEVQAVDCSYKPLISPLNRVGQLIVGL